MKTAAPKSKRSPTSQAATAAHAVRTVVQLLFATGKSYTLETIRSHLKDFFKDENDYEKRAVAHLSTVQLITALLDATPAIEAIGLQIRINNGTAQIFTSKVQNDRLSQFIIDHLPPKSQAPGLTQANLEVLACIAFKQPITQAEIDLLFGEIDKRHHVNALREMRLVEESPGPDGRLRFGTTAEFLQRFGLESPAILSDHIQ